MWFHAPAGARIVAKQPTIVVWIFVCSISLMFAGTTRSAEPQPLADPNTPVEMVRAIDSVEPSLAWEKPTGADPFHVIEGDGFSDNVVVEVGPYTLPPLNFQITKHKISFRLVSEAVPGVYAVRVRWPDGTTLCAQEPLIVRERPCQLQDVLFEKDSSDLTKESALILAENIACLARTEARPFTVIGFASRDGTDEANQQLSQARADAVANLLKLHLPQANITAIGLGEALPVQLGEVEREYAKNRRASIVTTSSAPCQPIRLSILEDGSPKLAAQKILEGAAQCYVSRDVTRVLVVVAEGDEERSSSPRKATRLAGAIRSEVGKRTFGGGAPPIIQPVYASAREAEAFAGVFGMTPAPRDRDIAEVYPIAWFFQARKLASAEDYVPECADRKVLVNKEGEVVVKRSVEGLAQIRLGGMYALEQTHLGASFRAGAAVAHFGETQSASLVLAVDFGIFAGEHEYRIAEDYSSQRLMPLRGVLGIKKEIGRFRFEIDLQPGLILPAAAAFLGDGEITLALRVFGDVEILGTFSGGVSVWRDAAVDPHWLGGVGVGWVFK